jgi:hypothetical protein
LPFSSSFTLNLNYYDNKIEWIRKKGKERKGKERKGKERKGKERKGKERKGKEREKVKSKKKVIQMNRLSRYKTKRNYLEFFSSSSPVSSFLFSESAISVLIFNYFFLIFILV